MQYYGRTVFTVSPAVRLFAFLSLSFLTVFALILVGGLEDLAQAFVHTALEISDYLHARAHTRIHIQYKTQGKDRVSY